LKPKTRERVILLAALLLLAAPIHVQARNQLPPRPKKSPLQRIPAKILVAKSVYLDNETGFAAVGNDTLRELNKWGRFKVVGRADEAQLVFVLSTEEFNGDDFSGPDGRFDPGALHLPRKPLNAFLTVIDQATGNRLWIDSRPWGGLLTGANSAGRRLIARLRKRIEQQHAPA
jgi:hypothetical protein